MIEDVSGWPGIEGTFDPRDVTLYADGRVVTSDPARNAILTTTGGDALPRGPRPGVGDGGRDEARPGPLAGSPRAVRRGDDTDPGRRRARATALSIYALGAGMARGTWATSHRCPTTRWPSAGTRRACAPSCARRRARRHTRRRRSCCGGRRSSRRRRASSPGSSRGRRRSTWRPRGLPWTTPVRPLRARGGRRGRGRRGACATSPTTWRWSRPGRATRSPSAPIYPDELGSVACP